MTEADKHIQDLLAKKLDQFESPVSSGIWENIASQLPTQPAVIGSASSITTILKIAAAVVISGAIAVAYIVTSSEKESQTESQQNSPVQTTAESDGQKTSVSEDTLSQTTPPANATSDRVISDNSSQNITSPNTSVPTIPYQSYPDYSELIQAIDPNEIQSSSSNTADTSPQNSIENSQSQDSGANQNASERIDENDPLFSIQAKEIDPKRLMYFFFCGAEVKKISWHLASAQIADTKSFNHSFEDEGLYTVKMKASLISGQEIEKSLTLEVVKPVEFKLPNAFSPGNDGYNDDFDVAAGIENEKEILQLIIQDRSGNVVYSSASQFIWNGRKMNGDLCEPGAYSYSILLTDKKNNSQTKNGTIQLFRE